MSGFYTEVAGECIEGMNGGSRDKHDETNWRSTISNNVQSIVRSLKEDLPSVDWRGPARD